METSPEIPITIESLETIQKEYREKALQYQMAWDTIEALKNHHFPAFKLEVAEKKD